MSAYCTATQRILLQWRITSAGPPGIMFVEFFHETEYLPAIYGYYILHGARPHCVQVKHLLRNQQIGALQLVLHLKLTQMYRSEPFYW